MELLHSVGSRIATPSTPDTPIATYAAEMRRWEHDRDLLLTAVRAYPTSRFLAIFDSIRYNLQLEELRLAPADKIERFFAAVDAKREEVKSESFRLY